MSCFFRQRTNKEGKRWQTGKKIKVIKEKVAANSRAVARVAVVNRLVAVRVVADNPVDSVAVAEAVATANVNCSYLMR
jgi:hypothetical protein